MSLIFRIMAFGFGAGWCMTFHQWRHLRCLSAQSELSECETCGRRWTTNHDVGVTLPWDSHMQKFWADRETRRFGRPIVD